MADDQTMNAPAPSGRFLDGQVAIVTGASQGIGRGISLAFADAGATVVAAARTRANLDETCRLVEARGGVAVAIECDVQDADYVRRCVDETVERFGGIDVLVNNAQNINYQVLVDSDDGVMDDAWRSGPFATFRFMRHAHPWLRDRHGVIVNVSSSSTILPNTSRYATYNAVKLAIEGLTRAAADEWAADGIRAFTIHPTAESAMSLNWKAREPEQYAAAVAAMPGGRLGDPELDIGRPLAVLVHHASDYSGKTLHLGSGGVSETVGTVSHVPVTLPSDG